jgi:hypothetical protein
VKYYIERMTKTEIQLTTAYKLFLGDEQIWPDECDHTLKTLRQLDDPLQEFYNLLVIVECLPISIIPLRYSLIGVMCDLKEHLDKSLDLVQKFRIICRCSSSGRILKQQLEQRSNIIVTLEAVIDSNKELTGKMCNTIDQARFLEIQQL